MGAGPVEQRIPLPVCGNQRCDLRHAGDVVVVPVDPGWSDVGGWAALYELGSKDEDDNVLSGDVVSFDARSNYVRSSPGKRVSLVGLSDLVVVVEGDDILILPRARAQDVRLLAQRRSSASPRSD